MSAEHAQRQHLEELRKERNIVKTPPHQSITPEKNKRTARKSTHSGRFSAVDGGDSLVGKDDDNSTASDTSRDSRTSEMEVPRVITTSESVLGKPSEKQNIAKRLEKSEDSVKTTPVISQTTVVVQENSENAKKDDQSDQPSIDNIDNLNDGDNEKDIVKSPVNEENVDGLENVEEKSSTVAIDKKILVSTENPSVISSKDEIFDKQKQKLKGDIHAPLETTSESDSLSKDAIFDKLKEDVPVETNSESDSLSKDAIFDKLKVNVPLETISESDSLSKDTLFDKLTGYPLEPISESESSSKDAIFDKLKGDLPLETTSEDVKAVLKDNQEALDSIFDKLRGDVPPKTTLENVTSEKEVKKAGHETLDSIFDELRGDKNVSLETSSGDADKAIQADNHEMSDTIFDKLRASIPSKPTLEDETVGDLEPKDDNKTLESILKKVVDVPSETTLEDAAVSKSVQKDNHETSDSIVGKPLGDVLLKTTLKGAAMGEIVQKENDEESDSIFDKLLGDVPLKRPLEDVPTDKTVSEDDHETLDSFSHKFDVDSSSEESLESKSTKPISKDKQSETLLKDAFLDKLREDAMALKCPSSMVNKKVLEDVLKENVDVDVVGDKTPSSNTGVLKVVSTKTVDKNPISETASTEESLKGEEESTPEKQPEDMKKVWDNIRKDLTLTGDAEDPDEKENFDVMEELPFGESLPQTEEEPSDWEEWEENSEHEEQDDPVELEPEPRAVGECVLISSDDDHSKDSQTAAADKVKKADTTRVESEKEETTSKVEKAVPVPTNSSVAENVEKISQVDTATTDKVEPILSEASDAEDPPSKKGKMEVEEMADSEKEEEKLEVSVEIVEPDMPELEKMQEKSDSPDIRLEMECVPEDVKPPTDEKVSEDDLAIVNEKKGGKRAADDVNASGDTDDKSDVKKLKLETEVKEEDVIEEKPSTTILSKKILEELISRKIKDFMTDGNKSAFSALKERCDSLEKSVERWKFRAQHLQNQLNELVLEQKRYNSRKVKVPTRTVGINVRMVQQVVSTTASPMKPPVSTASTLSTAKGSDKTPTTRAGPVPLQLIANMASTTPTKSTSVLSPSTQASTKPVSVTSTGSVKIIDLTQDEEHAAAAAKTIAAALPAGTVVRPQPPVTIQPTPVVNVPVVQGGVSSVMQLIPTSAASLTTGARLTSPTTMAPGARVTYLVPGTLGGPRQLMTFPQQNILQGTRQPMQTILLRMNTVPQSGATAQFVTTTPTNSTLSLVTSPTAATTIRAPISTQTFIRAPTPVTAATDTTTQSTTPMNAQTLVISCLAKHPASLPTSVTYPEDPKLKSLPPRPALKISKVAHGIVLSWNMTVNAIHADISVYQLYAYQETTGPPSTSLWKKVGDVRALPLPMACTLTQFVQGHKYHFAVRAVDAHNRLGPFSEPTSIVLNSK